MLSHLEAETLNLVECRCDLRNIYKKFRIFAIYCLDIINVFLFSLLANILLFVCLFVLCCCFDVVLIVVVAIVVVAAVIVISVVVGLIIPTQACFRRRTFHMLNHELKQTL